MIEKEQKAADELSALRGVIAKRYCEEIDGAQTLVRQGKAEMVATAIARSTAFRDVVREIDLMIANRNPGAKGAES